MKKFFYMISTVAFMASFASCNKMEQGNTPAEAPSIDGTTTITVSATVPQTKTYLNGGKTFWTSGDIVTLMGRDEASVVATATASAGGTQETSNFIFENWPVAATPEFLVFDGPLAYDEENYGGNKVMAPVLNEDGTITAEVRKHQEIVNKTNFSKYANLSIGALTEEAGVFATNMKNVCGLVKVQITKDSLEYIKIENLGESFMTGVVRVDYNNGKPRVVEVLNGSKEVKLTSHISNTDNKLPPGVFYACLLPGTYTPKVTMKPINGDEFSVTAKSEVTIERNKIMDFGQIDKISVTPDQPGTPDTPSESLVLTVDFASWPFTPVLNADPKGSTKIKTKDTYTLNQGGVEYSFEIYEPVYGYFYNGSALRFENASDSSGDGGYIKFPAVPGKKLSELTVSITNTSNKYVTMSTDGSDKADIVESTKIVKQSSETFDVSAKTEVNTSYYLNSKGSKIQIGKIVLTYK